MDLINVGRSIENKKYFYLYKKYFYSLGYQKNMQLHCQEAGKNSSPTKVTRSRDTQYGEQLVHFPSIYLLALCGRQTHREQSQPHREPDSGTPHLAGKTAVCREGCAPATPSRAAAEPSRMELGPWGAALGICPRPETTKPTTPNTHSCKNFNKTPVRASRKHPTLIYNNLRKETLL